jgi:hypothetical protein
MLYHLPILGDVLSGTKYIFIPNFIFTLRGLGVERNRKINNKRAYFFDPNNIPR